MSYMLGHLHNGWQVDQAILSEEDRVVVSFHQYAHNFFDVFICTYSYIDCFHCLFLRLYVLVTIGIQHV